MKKVVFFDLEGTLWNPSHELLRPAWDRLPAALRQLNISIPEGFDWSKMAGGTELEVVRKVVESTYPGMRWKKIQKWAKK